MKKQLGSVVVSVCLLTGCTTPFASKSADRSLDKDLDGVKYQLLELQNQLEKTKNEVNRNKVLIQDMEQAANKPKSTGPQFVNATQLNIREGAGLQFEPIGTVTLGSIVDIVDTSNPLWYKVKIDVAGLTSTKDKNSIKYKDSNGDRFIISNKYENSFQQLNDSNQLYVSSKYLLQQQEANTGVNVPADPKKPFTYGLLFFDPQTAKVMEGKIWSELKDQLIDKGYDGIKVVYVNRETFKKDVANNKYDAVESAPSDFIGINKNPKKPVLSAFAKTVDETTRQDHYSGIIIVNRDSGINDFEDLVGKKIAVRDNFSESGFKYQNYYLKTQEDINIEKDAKLETGYYHQEILFKVSSGQIDAGFVGDFVMTDPLYELKWAADKVGVKVNTDQELQALREKVYILPYKGNFNPIPNNPHSLKADLAKDKEFVKKLNEIVTDVYIKNKEGFDLTTANNEEYEFLRQFE
ncbi:PhnD/SsuA/transferrin family substrate-binding protein [Neobacillus sp. NPDC097160]|uniref:PhnD/SsuA/transferrin family substrate-binding protein n=1 Tax=Neobacillus sp. NPDC097160 TaxID=3364298 RepID=UPI00380672C2